MYYNRCRRPGTEFVTYFMLRHPVQAIDASNPPVCFNGILLRSPYEIVKDPGFWQYFRFAQG